MTKFRIDQPVIISRNKTGSDQSRKNITRRSRGVLDFSSEDDYLPRRKKGGKGIRFFDFYKSGISLHYNPDITFTGSAYGTFIFTYDSAATDLLRANLQAAILDGALTDGWKEQFSKVISGDLLERSIYALVDPADGLQRLDELDEWSSSALEITADHLADFALFSDSLVFHDVPRWNGSQKITREPNFEAAAAEFEPALQMDIYLMPSLVNSVIRTEYYNGLHLFTDEFDVIHSDFIRTSGAGGFSVTVLERALWRDLTQFIIDNPVINYARFWHFAELAQSHGSPQGKRIVTDFAEVPPYLYSATLIDGFEPNAAVYSAAGNHPDSSHFSISQNAGFGAADFQSQLVAAVKKGSEWFFFWRV